MNYLHKISLTMFQDGKVMSRIDLYGTSNKQVMRMNLSFHEAQFKRFHVENRKIYDRLMIKCYKITYCSEPFW